jgi:pentatricopeptide repeat protein
MYASWKLLAAAMGKDGEVLKSYQTYHEMAKAKFKEGGT